ncbi:uncharacterized protein ACO6RY_15352 [Pungitius sinensis]
MSQPDDPKESQSLLQSMLQRLNLKQVKEAQGYQHTPAPATAAWGQCEEGGAPIIRKVNSCPVNDFEPQPGLCEGGRGPISSPSQKDNIEADTGEERVLEHATQPGIIPTRTRQLFPAESRKDADIASCERTDGARGSSGSTAVTAHVPSNNNDVTAMGQRFGDLAKNRDMQIVATSSSRRKPPSSENKTKRWTQKIKERWRHRHGSFSNPGGKKGITLDLRKEPELFTAISVVKTANKVEERSLPSVDSTDPSRRPATRTEDNANQGCMGSHSDFQLGLGSFSLLEEIVTGQKWAKFLNPNQSAASANQRLPGLKIPSNLNDRGQTSPYFNGQGGVYKQRDSEASPDSGFIMSPDAFQPVSMDVLEAKQDAVQHVRSEPDTPEPMEHGHTRPSLCAEPKNFLESSVLRKRAQRSRKRPYYGEEMLPMEGINNGKEADRGNHVMEETGEEQRKDHVPPYTLNFASTPPSLPAPRGVLKHSISQDSHSSMEIKRRRVEENRRVHFSEEVVAIAPPGLDSYATDSDCEGGEAELEAEEQPAAVEEVTASARRAALPAWIQALKRRNIRRKYR